MQAERFLLFMKQIDAVYKSIQQLKSLVAATLGMKGVHTLWVYLLLSHPEGMTSAGMAERCAVDRSLVSREIEMLKERGIVTYSDANGRRTYNAPITLTELGKEYASRLGELALLIQEKADVGLTHAQVTDFYDTIEVFSRNLETAIQELNMKGDSNES